MGIQGRRACGDACAHAFAAAENALVPSGALAAAACLADSWHALATHVSYAAPRVEARKHTEPRAQVEATPISSAPLVATNLQARDILAPSSRPRSPRLALDSVGPGRQGRMAGPRSGAAACMVGGSIGRSAAVADPASPLWASGLPV